MIIARGSRDADGTMLLTFRQTEPRAPEQRRAPGCPDALHLRRVLSRELLGLVLGRVGGRILDRGGFVLALVLDRRRFVPGFVLDRRRLVLGAVHDVGGFVLAGRGYVLGLVAG